MCVHCRRRPATEADHQPPLALHVHVEESGCCHLIPSCGPCGRAQGAVLAAAMIPHVPSRPKPPAPPLEPVGWPADDPIWAVPWLAELVDTMPADATWPRFQTAPHPNAVGSYGATFAAWAQTRSGKALRWFQRLIAARLLEHDDQGVLVWDDALITVARQVGKSWLLRELCLWRIHQGDLFGEAQDVVHTGKDVAICKEVQRPARIWAKARPDLYRVREVNGQEEIELLADGSRWMLRAKDAVYGYAASLAVVDEAWKVPTMSIDEGLVPTQAERANAQLVLISTAHRRSTPLILTRRATALADLATTETLLVEWSAPADAELDDVDGWRAASPQWTWRRERLVAKALERARAGESDDPDEPDPLAAFAAQWLNRHPLRAAYTGPGDPLLVDGAWDACTGSLDVDGAAWVALEDNRGEGAGVAFAAADGAGRFEIDGIACPAWDEALRWARKFVDERPGSHLVVGASLRDQIPNDFPRRVAMRTGGIAETKRALPLLRALVAEHRIVHDGSHDLDAQIAAAKVRGNSAGQLTLVSQARSDVLRAALWALLYAQTPPANPAVY